MWGWGFTCPGLCVEVWKQLGGVGTFFLLCVRLRSCRQQEGTASPCTCWASFLQQVVTNRDLYQSTENRRCWTALPCPEWGICITSPRFREHFGRGQKGQMSWSWRVGKLLSQGHCLDLIQPLHLWTHCAVVDHTRHAQHWACQHFIMQGLMRLRPSLGTTDWWLMVTRRRGVTSACGVTTDRLSMLH